MVSYHLLCFRFLNLSHNAAFLIIHILAGTVALMSAALAVSSAKVYLDI